MDSGQAMLLLILGLFTFTANAKCHDPHQALIETLDKAAICLHHYPGKGEAVLLVHGIASNANFWDVSDDLSVAQTLQTQGFDVWALDERGHGAAKKNHERKRQRYGWTIDDYGRYDVDTAIQYIQDQGHTDVHYVGHSLGGMILAPYVAAHGTEALKSITVIASPMDFAHPDLLWRVANPIAALSPPKIPTDHIARMGAVFPRTPLGFDSLLFSEGSLTSKQRRTMYRRVVSPMTRKEITQFRRTFINGVFLSEDGINYEKTLETVQTPALVVAGRGDHAAPSDRVMGYYHALGSSEKKWIVMGTDFGHQHDYGHLDIILSDGAFDDFIPLFVDWLNTQSVSQDAP